MKVVSTKLSNEEHNAMLELANVLGMNTAEYVRGCITLNLCGSCKGVDVPLEKDQLLEQMMARNEIRFNGSQSKRKSTETEPNADSIVIISG